VPVSILPLFFVPLSEPSAFIKISGHEFIIMCYLLHSMYSWFEKVKCTKIIRETCYIYNFWYFTLDFWCFCVNFLLISVWCINGVVSASDVLQVADVFRSDGSGAGVFQFIENIDVRFLQLVLPTISWPVLLRSWFRKQMQNLGVSLDTETQEPAKVAACPSFLGHGPPPPPPHKPGFPWQSWTE
jgi:hypothetical protein